MRSLYGSAFLSALHEEGTKAEIIAFIKQFGAERNIPFTLNGDWSKEELMKELVRVYEHTFNQGS